MATRQYIRNFNYSGSFNGTNNGIDLGTPSALNFERTNAFSISAWIRTGGNVSSTIDIFSKRSVSGSTPGYTFTIPIGTNHLRMVLSNNSGSNLIDKDGILNITDAKWHHVVVTYDGSSLAAGVKIYVDNVQDPATVLNDTLSASILVANHASIGYRDPTGTPGSFYNGNMDEVAVYSKALSVTEIDLLYAGMLPTLVAPANLVGYWDFDESSGSSLLDKSVSNITGTWQGTLTSIHATNVARTARQKVGNFGFSGNFNGTDNYVDTGAFHPADTTGSLSMWAKFANVTTLQCLWGWGSTNAATTFLWALRLASATDTTPTAGNARIEIRATDNGVTQNITLVTGTNIVPNQWYHIAVTGNGTTYTIYINGVAQTITAITGSNSGLWIGGINQPVGTIHAEIGNEFVKNTQTVFFKGKIDNVAEYSRVLTSLEVLKLANNQIEATELSGLQGYWKFDEGTGTTVADSSGGGNTGTWGGTLTNQWSTDVVTPQRQLVRDFATSGFFNGIDGYVDAGTAAVLNPTGSTISVSAWFNSRRSNRFGAIIAKGENTAANSAFILSSNDTASKLDFIVMTSNSTTTAVITANDYFDGKWHHVVGTYDGSLGSNNLSLYVDGVLVGNNNLTGTILSSADPLQIGRWNSTGSFLKGNIQDVALYNTALTSGQVMQLYNNQILPNDASIVSGLAGYWPLTDGIGTTVADLSANNNPGTWQGTLGSQWSGNVPMRARPYIKDFGTDGYLNGVDNNITTTAHLLSNLTTLTVCFWAKPNTKTSRIELAEGNNGVTRGTYGLAEDGNAYILPASTGGFGFVNWSSYGTGNYIFYCGVFDGTQTGNAARAKIYLNGTLKNLTFSGTIPASIGSFTGTTTIGKRPTGELSTGFIDEVAIYNVPLTAAQILQLYYNQILPTQIAGLTGYYKLDEGSGTSVGDSSGNSNTGTWQGTLGGQWSTDVPMISRNST